MGLRKLLSFALLLSLLVLLGCSISPRRGPLFQASPGVLLLPDKVVPRQDIVDKALEADFILLGEGHSNRCDHRMQAALLEQMAAAGMKLVLGLEMLDIRVQPKLDRYNQGAFLLEEFADQVEWEENWGYPFALYRPVFETAARYSISLHALNIPSEIVRQVGQEGVESVSDSDRRFFPETILLPPQEQRERLKRQFLLHQKMLKREESDQGFERFMTAQSLWDTVMAQRALELAKHSGKKVVILAGGGHVEHGWGIENRILQLEPQAAVLKVMPWRGKGRPAPEQADLFYACPETHRSRKGYELQIQGNNIVISSVENESPAEEAGLRTGDRILRADGMDVQTLSDLHQAAVTASRENRPVVLEVERSGGIVTVKLRYGKEEQE